jgi:glutaredoxin
MKIASVAMAFCVTIFLFTANAGTVYKVVGPDGKITYSDHEPEKGQSSKALNFNDLPSSPVPPLPAEANKAKAALQARTSPVAEVQSRNVIFTASWCGYCKKAKVYLRNKGISIGELDIDTPSGRESYRSAGGSGIPLLLYQGKRVQGFSEPAYNAVFMQAK